MGIDNLLNFVKPALKQQSIVSFRGKKAAVDAMSWLYKGCYACAVDLNQNIQTNDFLYFLQKMINMLREYNVTPFLVFDGRKLKAKEKTEQFRKQLKLQNLAKGKELIEQGNTTEAKKYFQRCLKITKQMLYITFDFLKELQVQYMIAPYEADAQLAHLCLSGYCDFAITEDSDLICYLCPLIVFKLQTDGSCYELNLEYYRESQENRKQISSDDVRVLFSLKQEQLIDTCIMSGCDYVPSIRGIGIKKACELMYQQQSLENALSKLKKSKSLSTNIPKDYEKIVQSIRMIFLYQTVYDPIQEKYIQLNQVQYDDYQERLQHQEDNMENIRPNETLFKVEQLSQLVGEHIPENAQKPFSQGQLDFKTLEQREQTKIDFIKLFKKVDRTMYSQQKQSQTFVDLTQTKKNLQLIKEQNLQQTSFQDDDQPHEQIFIAPKQQPTQQKGIDIFDLCEQLFEANELPEQFQQEEGGQEEGDQEEGDQEEEEENSNSNVEENKVNPFQVQYQSEMKISLSQISSSHIIERSTEKSDRRQFGSKDKVLKQTQTSLFSFVKKKPQSEQVLSLQESQNILEELD